MIFKNDSSSPLSPTPYHQKAVFRLPSLGSNNQKTLSRRTKSTAILPHPNTYQSINRLENNSPSPGKPLLTWNQAENQESPLLRGDKHSGEGLSSKHIDPSKITQSLKSQTNFIEAKRTSPVQKFSNGALIRSHVPEKHDIRESKGKISNSSVQSNLNDYVPSNHAKSLNNSPKRRQDNPGRGRNLTLIESSGISKLHILTQDTKMNHHNGHSTPVQTLEPIKQTHPSNKIRITVDTKSHKSIPSINFSDAQMDSPTKLQNSLAEIRQLSPGKMPYRVIGKNNPSTLEYLFPMEGNSPLKNNSQKFDKKNCVMTYEFKTRAGKLPTNTFKPNQDSYILHPDFCGDKSKYFFAVCDGHGTNGHIVSNFVKNNLPKNLEIQFKIGQDKGEKYYEEIIKQSFFITNKQLGVSQIDANFSGSTTISCLIFGNKLWCANVGDSRAIIVKCKDNIWSVHPLSEDQKPGNNGELERILQAGGRVEPFQDMHGNPLGPDRVWLKDEDIPGLAMSRSIGDFVAGRVGVIAEPEIRSFELTEEDKFIVIASDGVWEFLSNERVMELIVPFYLKNNLSNACKCLVKNSLEGWIEDGDVVDDITCVIISLKA